MNTLYAFGCSFTDWNYQKSAYDWWKEEHHFIHRLSVELGMKCVNTGHSGDANESILRNFYKYQNQFKKGDVVLLQSTFGNRLVFHHHPTSEQFDLTGPINQLPPTNQKDFRDRFSSHFIKTIKEYLVLYNHPDFIIDEMYAAYPMISEWCKMKGIHIVFWALDDYIPSELVTRAPNGKGWCNWITENGLTINDDIGNDDDHLGFTGMDTMYEKFILILRNVMLRNN